MNSIIKDQLTTEITDKDRLDWIEQWAKRSPSGVSFDHVPSCEGDLKGFRFMRRFHIGQPCKSVRAAIDAEIIRDRE